MRMLRSKTASEHFCRAFLRRESRGYSSPHTYVDGATGSGKGWLRQVLEKRDGTIDQRSNKYCHSKKDSEKRKKEKERRVQESRK